MSDRERAMQLLEKVPETKLYYIIGILEGAIIPDIEEVEPDEWDLKMIEEANKENDGEEISLEDTKKELGLFEANVLSFQRIMKGYRSL